MADAPGGLEIQITSNGRTPTYTVRGGGPGDVGPAIEGLHPHQQDALASANAGGRPYSVDIKVDAGGRTSSTVRTLDPDGRIVTRSNESASTGGGIYSERAGDPSGSQSGRPVEYSIDDGSPVSPTKQDDGVATVMGPDDPEARPDPGAPNERGDVRPPDPNESTDDYELGDEKPFDPENDTFDWSDKKQGEQGSAEQGPAEENPQPDKRKEDDSEPDKKCGEKGCSETESSPILDGALSFGYGLLKGAVIAVGVTLALGALGLSGPLVAAGLATVGVLGAIGLVSSWGSMSTNDRAQAVGELVGGIVAGGLMARGILGRGRTGGRGQKGDPEQPAGGPKPHPEDPPPKQPRPDEPPPEKPPPKKPAGTTQQRVPSRNQFRTDADVPAKYRNDPKYQDLLKDPDQLGKPPTSSTRAEAVAGLEAEAKGILDAPIRRGPKGTEFYDGKGGLWDVKAPPSPQPGQGWKFNPRESGTSVLEKLEQPRLDPETGTMKPVDVLLDETYMTSGDRAALWSWLHENLSPEQLARVRPVQVPL